MLQALYYVFHFQISLRNARLLAEMVGSIIRFSRYSRSFSPHINGTCYSQKLACQLMDTWESPIGTIQVYGEFVLPDSGCGSQEALVDMNMTILTGMECSEKQLRTLLHSAGFTVI